MLRKYKKRLYINKKFPVVQLMFYFYESTNDFLYDKSLMIY